MNRKISILVAGLALAATMTGCTRTATHVTPYGRLSRSTAAGDYARSNVGIVDEPGYRYDGIASNYRLPRAATGYVDSDGRWQNNTARTTTPSTTLNPDGYPNAATMYR